MPKEMLLLPIVLPILSGLALFIIRPKTYNGRRNYVMTMVTLNSVITFILLFSDLRESLQLLQITDDVNLVLKIDGLSTIFAGLVSFMWPLASMYAFDYMKHEKNLDMFFAFYTITYGVVVGIAFAGNALTLYLFYEFLTLVTTPLVLHTQKREAVVAARKYLTYSITGAAIGFISIVFVLVYGNGSGFVFGGILDSSALVGYGDNILLTTYVLAFIGFGVKAAIFPFHGWLPSASVAPTPVTALLHAVAVVKAGVFVIMRMTFYVYDIDVLRGTWAQAVVLSLAFITVIYASVMACKEQHFKRRLAYSTISNLSYILLGVCLMTHLGFLAALIHMLFHAIMKICGFFCAGAVMEYTDARYVNQLEGMGKKMPFIFTCFAITSLSLMGTPLMVGFISKYYLITAAINLGGVLGYMMIAALFTSAVLVAVYMVFIVVRAFFPRENVEIMEAKTPGLWMRIPIGIFAAMIVVLGVNSQFLVDYLTKVATGLI
ncbi:MAG: proton-conducting transporter membrane subunit [Clostridia bacterium]